MATAEIGELLHVTPRYVRKWRGRYEREGVGALRVGYGGSESYLRGEQRQELEDWVGAQETVTVEEV
jgi:transposase